MQSGASNPFQSGTRVLLTEDLTAISPELQQGILGAVISIAPIRPANPEHLMYLVRFPGIPDFYYAAHELVKAADQSAEVYT